MSLQFFSLSLVLLSLSAHQASSTPPPLTLTLVNDCNFTVWPAIQPNAGQPVLERGGFALATHTHRSFPAPTSHWSGRIWARTGCTYTHPHGFRCATGDCAGHFECNGHGGAPPATLAQFATRHGHNNAYSSYGVSLVDGFNIPLTITPHGGTGQCPVVGCAKDLLATCPGPLQVHEGHRVVGCKSGCEAFRKDELCCTNKYNNPHMCKASVWSEYFKHACPSTFTYAHDTPSLMHECSNPNELKVIFCHDYKS